MPLNSVEYSKPSAPLPVIRRDKKVNGKRRKSELLDGVFFNAFDNLAGGALRSAGAHITVIGNSDPLTLIPKPWRDVSEQLRALFYSLAIRSHGTDLTVSTKQHVQAFTLRLHRNQFAKARDPDLKSFADYMRRRITHHLDRLFHDIQFWFVIEEGRTFGEGLHLHGEISIGPYAPDYAEDDRIRAALKLAAGGAWEDYAANRQLVMPDRTPDLYWTAYSVKHVRLSRHSFRRFMLGFGPLPKCLSVSFNGLSIATTRTIKAKARALYEDAAQAIRDSHRASPVRKAASPVRM